MKRDIIYCYYTDSYYVESTIKPQNEYTTKIRLTADEGKSLTKDGIDLYPSVIIDESGISEWFEVDSPPEPEDFSLQDEALESNSLEPTE